MPASPLFGLSRKQDIHTEESGPADIRARTERVEDSVLLLEQSRSADFYFIFSPQVKNILSVCLNCLTIQLTAPTQALMLTCQQINSQLTSSQQKNTCRPIAVHRRRGLDGYVLKNKNQKNKHRIQNAITQLSLITQD